MDNWEQPRTHVSLMSPEETQMQRRLNITSVVSAAISLISLVALLVTASRSTLWLAVFAILGAVVALFTRHHVTRERLKHWT
jgi:hypothetical protein